MTTNKTPFEELKTYLAKQRRLNHLISILNFDIETKAPEKAIDAENDLVADLYGDLVAIEQDPEFIRLVRLADKDPSLNERQRCLVNSLLKSVDFASKVPAETLRDWNKTTSKCTEVWRKCKHKDGGDYQTVLPYFEKLVEVKREEAKLKRKPYHKTAYDVLLDDYEDGYSEEVLDKIFGVLRDFLSKNLPNALKKQELAKR